MCGCVTCFANKWTILLVIHSKAIQVLAKELLCVLGERCKIKAEHSDSKHTKEGSTMCSVTMSFIFADLW